MFAQIHLLFTLIFLDMPICHINLLYYIINNTTSNKKIDQNDIISNFLPKN